MALHAKPAGGASQALKRRTVVVAASALVASVVPMAVAATPAFAQLSGAIFTTNAGCSQVNGNLYSSKQDVFLNGGPHSDNGGAGLPSNTYFVQVTDPSGAAVLGTSVGSGVERPITVGEDGSFASCYQLWSLVADAVGAEGYATTPNQGGEYKVWVSSVSTFPNDSTKTDNFKVVITPPPTDGGLRGISVSTSATSIKNVASTWTLDKSVTPGTVNGWAGGSTTAATWKVVADRTDTPTWKVSGDVVVTNAGSDPVTVTVEDTLGDAAATHPVLNCGTPVTGTSNVYAVPGTGELTCTFTDTAVTSDPVENTALVSVITGGVPGGEDVAPVVNDPTTDTASGDPSITVDDSRAAAGAPNSEAVSADTTWTYAETFPCPVPSADAVYANGVLTRTVTNTAVGDFASATTDLSDTADVTVNCYALIVDDPASTSWNRSYGWGLTKTVDKATHTLAPGASGISNYTVTATRSTTENGFNVAGTVTVTNPSPEDVTVAVSVDLPTSACNANLLVPAGQSKTCSYSSSVPTKAPGTVTATVTINGLTFTDGDSYTFSDEPTTTTGKASVTVTDTFNGSVIRSKSATDGLAELKYSETFSCSRNAADYTDGAYSTSTTNVAVISDPALQASKSVTKNCVATWKAESATPRGPIWPKHGGNWFMYTPYTAGPIDLLAGQTYKAGTITMAPSATPGKTDITITFNNNYRLRSGLTNNVKVQPMGTAPTSYTQPGAFTQKFTKTGSPITVTVPTAAFYGIHLDVERAIF